MNRPSLVLVGGFLAEGKASLLLQAARLLRQRGLRAGIITNDQAGSLVDTRLVEGVGLPVE
jgi:Ni2+-binding GTPase involved in maturation of urease and hydrogenase